LTDWLIWLCAQGKLLWTDSTVTGHHFLCAGYVSVENGGELIMDLTVVNAHVYLMVRASSRVKYTLIVCCIFGLLFVVHCTAG
jgi:hypothetical protein